MDFYYLQENIKKQILDTGLDSLKTASKRVVHRAGEYLGNKVADAVINSNDDKIAKPDKNPINVEETNRKKK